MRIAVLVKQVPRPADMRVAEGRMVRDGVELEVDAYCRRANTRAVELAGPNGEVVAVAMGPPSASDALREMIACGASRGVHLCDPAFAGADTLATAVTIATALRSQGPFDLILCGLHSVDSDTGQLGPQVAELLGLPFAAAARELTAIEERVNATLETDDGSRTVILPMPAVISVAERLCQPSKANVEVWQRVSVKRIQTIGAAALGLGTTDVGLSGSPTQVGKPRFLEISRRRQFVEDASAAAEFLVGLELLTSKEPRQPLGVVPATGDTGPEIWCLVDNAEKGIAAEMLSTAATLAHSIRGAVVAVTTEPVPRDLGRWGADTTYVIPHASEAEQWAASIARIALTALPFAILAASTRLGRETMSRLAARCRWGLIGDAIGVELGGDHKLVALKPALGGQILAPISSSSPVQLVTLRPGSSKPMRPRDSPDPTPRYLSSPPPSMIQTLRTTCTDHELYSFLTAPVVVGVGTGVQPDEYFRLDRLRTELLDAPLGATRKVTDRGWLPRSRQIGITGHSIGPRLYVAIGVQGTINHAVGIRNAEIVLAINRDPDAPIFQHADIAIVADWHDAVQGLASALGDHRREAVTACET